MDSFYRIAGLGNSMATLTLCVMGKDHELFAGQIASRCGKEVNRDPLFMVRTTACFCR